MNPLCVFDYIDIELYQIKSFIRLTLISHPPDGTAQTGICFVEDLYDLMAFLSVYFIFSLIIISVFLFLTQIFEFNYCIVLACSD